MAAVPIDIHSYGATPPQHIPTPQTSALYMPHAPAVISPVAVPQAQAPVPPPAPIVLPTQPMVGDLPPHTRPKPPAFPPPQPPAQPPPPTSTPRAADTASPTKAVLQSVLTKLDEIQRHQRQAHSTGQRGAGKWTNSAGGNNEPYPPYKYPRYSDLPRDSFSDYEHDQRAPYMAPNSLQTTTHPRPRNLHVSDFRYQQPTFMPAPPPPPPPPPRSHVAPRPPVPTITPSMPVADAPTMTLTEAFHAISRQLSQDRQEGKKERAAERVQEVQDIRTLVQGMLQGVGQTQSTGGETPIGGTRVEPKAGSSRGKISQMTPAQAVAGPSNPGSRLTQNVSRDLNEGMASSSDDDVREVEPTREVGSTRQTNKRQRGNVAKPPSKRAKGKAAAKRATEDSEALPAAPAPPEDAQGNTHACRTRPPVQCPDVPLPEQLRNPFSLSEDTIQAWKGWFIHATAAERRHLFNSARMAVKEGLQAAFTMLCGANTAMQYKLFRMLMPYGTRCWEGDLAGILARIIWTHKDQILRLIVATSTDGEDMGGTMMVDERPPPVPAGFQDRVIPGQPAAPGDRSNTAPGSTSGPPHGSNMERPDAGAQHTIDTATQRVVS
jgi:hypothetical protein